MWLVEFNHLRNEYLNCLLVIGDTLVCKLRVVKVVVPIGYSTTLHQGMIFKWHGTIFIFRNVEEGFNFETIFHGAYLWQYLLIIILSNDNKNNNGDDSVWFLQGKVKDIELKGHTDSVDQLCWDPKHGDLIATASGDKTVRLWDARSKLLLYSISISVELVWNLTS